MPYRQSLKRFSRQSWDAYVAEFSEVHDETLMEGVVAGCAIVAYADGWVTDAERKRMLGLIRDFPPIVPFGIDEVLGVFEELSTQYATNHEAADARALSMVTSVKGRDRYPELLVQTCCAIAAADGGFDEEERRAATRICEALGLAAGDFDLGDAP
jgi:tellurite resistance protein TerB